MTHPRADSRIDRMVRRIRPSVRAERQYLVGGIPNCSVKLNQNESPFDVAPELKRVLADEFVRIECNRYPTEQPDALRDAIAAHTRYDANGILVGNGSNELTFTLGLALIEKGVSVVLPRPMFALFESVTRLYEGHLVSVPPRSDLSFDVDGICDAIERVQPALTIVATPNNPTGLAIPIEDLHRLASVSDGFLVVDEAYVEFSEEDTAQALLQDHPNVVILRTFSKALGLAGLRIGYIIARPEIAREFLKARLPFMVDRYAQAVGISVLERTDLLARRIAEIKASRQELLESLSALESVQVVPSQANFVLFKTEIDAARLMVELAESGVLVRNMSGYAELTDYLRVSAGTRRENQAFLTALKAALYAG